MAILLQDNFNASDGTLLAGRTPDVGSVWATPAPTPSGLAIYNNRLSFGTFYDFHLNTTILPSNQYAQVEHFSSVNGNYTELLARFSGNNGYWLDLTSSGDNYNMRIVRTTGGSHTFLTSSIPVAALGTIHTFKIEAIGTSIKAYMDDVLKLSVVNTLYASGYAGVGGFFSTNSYFDNFTAGSAGGVENVVSGSGGKGGQGMIVANIRATIKRGTASTWITP